MGPETDLPSVTPRLNSRRSKVSEYWCTVPRTFDHVLVNVRRAVPGGNVLVAGRFVTDSDLRQVSPAPRMEGSPGPQMEGGAAESRAANGPRPAESRAANGSD